MMLRALHIVQKISFFLNFLSEDFDALRQNNYDALIMTKMALQTKWKCKMFFFVTTYATFLLRRYLRCFVLLMLIGVSKLADFDFLTQARTEHHIQNKNNNNNKNRVVWTGVSKLDPADFDFPTQIASHAPIISSHQRILFFLTDIRNLFIK